MWLLPWEKLPPLILGPLLILISAIALFDQMTENKDWPDLTWLWIGLLGGIAITTFGLVTWWRKKN
ncbi:hypothetical protein [Undibacterium sp. Ji22W]|uniref:hypothetical protein n=1 Tax=Undibacterium sp. Ji22W TaxID=3413038 RepID=UPI003BF04B91